MGQGARIVVCNGPDRGRTFPVTGDVVHIGRGMDNNIVLADPEILDYHFSVSYRDGQCAVSAASTGGVVINGQSIPAEQWVAIAPPARVQVSVETELEILTNEDLTGSVTLTGAEGSSSVAKRRQAAAKGKKKTRSTGPRQVAKFITDRPGDPLVKLGTDGRLPELALSENATVKRESKRETSPLLLVVVLGGSLALSLGMLLLDADPAVTQSDSRGSARQKLSEYYRGENAKLLPYQKYLRRAVVAHSQGDAAFERRMYFAVLDLLDAADVRDQANLNGLTGKHTGRGRSSDAELRDLLETLVAR